MHELDIDIDDSNLNPRAFKVIDNSSWDNNLEVKNAILEITPPGFSNCIILKVKRNFIELLNANLLKLNTSNLKIIPTLPDGLYSIKFSVDPNIDTKIEFYYFRNVKQKIKYFNLLTLLLNNRIKYTNKEFKEKKEKILWIRELIEGCKYMAEDKNDVRKANLMYKEIASELEKFKLIC